MTPKSQTSYQLPKQSAIYLSFIFTEPKLQVPIHWSLSSITIQQIKSFQHIKYIILLMHQNTILSFSKLNSQKICQLTKISHLKFVFKTILHGFYLIPTTPSNE